MAVNQANGPVPLYVHTIYRILRVMRLKQQETGGTFDYVLFKKHVDAAGLSFDQLRPLQQRLDTLESFMPQGQTIAPPSKAKGKSGPTTGNDWTPKVYCPRSECSLPRLIYKGRYSHNCRFVMPMCYTRRSMCTVQHLLKHISREEHIRRPSHRSRRSPQGNLASPNPPSATFYLKMTNRT